MEVQAHPQRHRVAVCVADQGVGVWRALADSPHSPDTESDSLSLAITEQVARDGSGGHGNGLWALSRIVAAGAGWLAITSGTAGLQVRRAGPRTSNAGFAVDPQWRGVSVDFQLNVGEPIAGVQGGRGHAAG